MSVPLIERTQHKLREARFFYRHLLNEARDPDTNEPRAFRFYLSAFISAGRSVTFALEVEQDENYKAWFRPWLSCLTDEDRQLMESMTEQRNSEQHRGGARLREDWEYVSLFEARRGVRDRGAARITWSGPLGAPPPKIGRRVYSFASDGHKGEIIEKCKKYLDLLDRLVKDFIQANTV